MNLLNNHCPRYFITWKTSKYLIGLTDVQVPKLFLCAAYDLESRQSYIKLCIRILNMNNIRN